MATVEKLASFTDERMALLVDAVQQLSLARSLSDIQTVVRGVARALTGADGATFVLRDRDQCFYLDEDAIAPLWKGQRFPLEACISGWAMLNKQHVVIPDIYLDDRIPHDAYRPTFVKSLVMMPIRSLEPVGSIGNYWARYHVPSEEDIALLRALADSTAVAMENVKMLEERDYQVRLLHTLAHEVRNPLSAAQALVDHVGRRDNGAADPDLLLVQDSLAEAMRIVSEQLDVAKLEAGETRTQVEEFALAPVLEGLRDSFSPMCHDGVSLRVEVPPGMVVRTDRRVLGQIIRTLLSNALKFTDHGEIRISAVESEPALELAVSDTGLGIAESDQERIFEEFQQVEHAQAGRRPGTGLGLPLVRRLARALDGQISLQSTVGEGSRFTLRLPR